MAGEPSLQPPPANAAGGVGTPPRGGGSAFNNGDLAVLLSEFQRVRDADEADGQLAGEAMTLAATAVRIVEAQLGRAGPDGLSPADLATAREVLQGALGALRAALNRMEDADPAPARGLRTKLLRRRPENGRR